MGFSYFIRTFGCQMNVFDSEVIGGLLDKLGHKPTISEETADIIILNTCCVRESAENKLYGKLGRLKKLKEVNPDLIIGVCGCLPQQKGMVDEIKRRFPHVDLLFGTHNIHRLPDLLKDIQEKKQHSYEIWPKAENTIEGLPVTRGDHIRAWVPVIHGCNNFCTYCIVPYVRGRERSREQKAIISEVESLVQGGYKEIFLLGQNVNSYGKDLKVKTDFAGLLQKVNEIPGNFWIRYITSHPKDFSNSLIDAIAKSSKVCEHVHLPVQAGSTNILKKMHRGYTREDYLALVKRIRGKIPGVSLTTDIMVGFPGETEDDFRDTLDLVEEIQYDGAFTFVYNIRRGTPAATMAEQVPGKEKIKRITELIKIQNSISLRLNRGEEGTVKEVLVEGYSKKDEHFLTGRTRTNKLVVFEGGKDLIGKLIKIKIEKGELSYLRGSIAN
ncbi:MAG TPA: tRNA (N6-isopentenyl adenosine(37)-C2)-methylthiotransferase MiaB [Clostridia bacterium]|nr:tRNA (N6-isopentenyl adenosine(37)-C2)-methylthiotransferase MiaB [Clostridia bacterium]